MCYLMYPLIKLKATDKIKHKKNFFSLVCFTEMTGLYLIHTETRAHRQSCCICSEKTLPAAVWVCFFVFVFKVALDYITFNTNLKSVHHHCGDVGDTYLNMNMLITSRDTVLLSLFSQYKHRKYDLKRFRK